jgi:hypothetical protein
VPAGEAVSEPKDDDGGSMKDVDDDRPTQEWSSPTLTDWGRHPFDGYLLADAPKPNWLNRLFQFLGWPEGDLLAGLDLDGLAGPRISAHPGGTILNLEHAESSQADFVAVLEMAGGQRHQVAQHGFGLLLRQVVALSQFGGHLLERDSGLGSAGFESNGITVSLNLFGARHLPGLIGFEQINPPSCGGNPSR